MQSFSKLAAAAACLFIAQTGAAFAEPSSQVSNDEVQQALDSCPKGMVEGPDGVCVHPKSGRMGFDLAAPTDAGNANVASLGNTRSVGSSARHITSAAQKTVDLRLSFGVGSADLNDQDKANAKTLAAMLTQPKYAPAKVLIAGHTDHSGSAAYNMDLSKRRAESVKQFLVAQGVDAGRIETVGYGYTKLGKRIVIARRIE